MQSDYNGLTQVLEDLENAIRQAALESQRREREALPQAEIIPFPLLMPQHEPKDAS